VRETWVRGRYWDEPGIGLDESCGWPGPAFGMSGEGEGPGYAEGNGDGYGAGYGAKTGVYPNGRKPHGLSFIGFGGLRHVTYSGTS